MESHNNEETRVCDGMSFQGPAKIGRMLQDLVRLAATPKGRAEAIAFIAQHPNYRRALSHVEETRTAIRNGSQSEKTKKGLMFLVDLVAKDFEEMTPRDLVYLTWFFDGPEYRHIWAEEEA